MTTLRKQQLEQNSCNRNEQVIKVIIKRLEKAADALQDELNSIHNIEVDTEYCELVPMYESLAADALDKLTSISSESRHIFKEHGYAKASAEKAKGME